MTRGELVEIFQKDIGEALGTTEFLSVLHDLDTLMDFIDGTHNEQTELEIGE